MPRSLKQTALVLTLVASLAATAVPRRAEALVVGQPWTLAVFGLGFLGVMSYPHEYLDSTRAFAKNVSALLFWGGLLLLDGTEDVAFAPIQDPAQADRLGLSAPELAAFNAEVLQLNLLREEVKQAISGGEFKSRREAFDASRALWQARADELSPEAYSAAQKVARALAHTAAAQ